MAMLTEKDDWRLKGTEDYLQGAALMLTRYIRRSEWDDHEHCDFCWAKFSEYEGDLREGYVAKVDGQDYWICPVCCRDFKERFGWTVEE